MDLENNQKFEDIDALLRGVFYETSLREMFEKRLHSLKTNQTTVQKLLKIERRTINGILDGTQRRADVKNYEKLSTFLNVPVERVMQLHLEEVEKSLSANETPTYKKKVMREKFDLTVLRKAGFIKDASNYAEAEKKIISYFGFTKISEYEKRSIKALFSKGSIAASAKIDSTREFWLTSVKTIAVKLDNPYPYDRQKLINYFPQIRWNCTNVSQGLTNVIKALYRLGVTVIYQPPFSSLHLRGATFQVNNKPCVALTNYRGFYPTLWHCLIHELYHILFDWDQIKEDACHISEDTDERGTIEENELDADRFARDYFFSGEKLDEVKEYMRDTKYIEEVAKNNHVHPSFIYVYYAYENGAIDRKAWSRAKFQNADVKKAVYRLENNWDNPLPIEDFSKKLKLEIYN